MKTCIQTSCSSLVRSLLHNIRSLQQIDVNCDLMNVSCICLNTCFFSNGRDVSLYIGFSRMSSGLNKYFLAFSISCRSVGKTTHFNLYIIILYDSYKVSEIRPSCTYFNGCARIYYRISTH